MEQLKIPGYEEALKEERRLREEIFLDSVPTIGGIVVNHITPFLLARLSLMETPFLSGGLYNDEETLRFIWAISPDFVPISHPEFQDRLYILTALIRKNHPTDFYELQDGIDAFIKATFIDGPKGGVESVPYVTGVAWTVFQMAKEPFRWDEQRTIHTSLRKLYQYLRCVKLERGDVMFNDSDWVKDKFLHDLRDGKVSGLS